MRKTLLAVVLFALATGCGQTPDSSSKAAAAASRPAASLDPQERLRTYAKCMRDNGVDMPDPGPDGSIQTDERGIDRATMEKAEAACGAILGSGGGSSGGGNGGGGDLSPEQKDQLRAYAKCMRDNGVDMPDPVFQGGGRYAVGGPGMKVQPDDPAYKKAEEVCRDKAGGLLG